MLLGAAINVGESSTILEVLNFTYSLAAIFVIKLIFIQVA